ncbi:uncharacterized protein LOC142913599 [Petromyzon marinus]|uniref:uncharacterized protein LOC142913599 n=1 Tax=Petromyzon marinus TaxID=7757 RepID=UPI003F6F8497
MAEKMDKADRSLTERLMGRLHPPRLSRNLSLRRENTAAAASRGGAAGGAHTIARIPLAGGDHRRPHTACELERPEEREEQRAAAGAATGRAVSACDMAVAGTPLAEEGATGTPGEAGRRPLPPSPPENKASEMHRSRARDVGARPETSLRRWLGDVSCLAWYAGGRGFDPDPDDACCCIFGVCVSLSLSPWSRGFFSRSSDFSFHI